MLRRSQINELIDIVLNARLAQYRIRYDAAGNPEQSETVRGLRLSAITIPQLDPERPAFTFGERNSTSDEAEAVSKSSCLIAHARQSLEQTRLEIQSRPCDLPRPELTIAPAGSQRSTVLRKSIRPSSTPEYCRRSRPRGPDRQSFPTYRRNSSFP